MLHPPGGLVAPRGPMRRTGHQRALVKGHQVHAPTAGASEPTQAMTAAAAPPSSAASFHSSKSSTSPRSESGTDYWAFDVPEDG